MKIHRKYILKYKLWWIGPSSLIQHVSNVAKNCWSKFYISRSSQSSSTKFKFRVARIQFLSQTQCHIFLVFPFSQEEKGKQQWETQHHWIKNLPFTAITEDLQLSCTLTLSCMMLFRNKLNRQSRLIVMSFLCVTFPFQTIYAS